MLVLVGLLLAVATVADVGRQAGINHRLDADLRSWRLYTHHDYKNVGADQELLGVQTKRDVVCGNAEPGPPKARPQICLVMTGPTRGGLRQVAGGWYLPAGTEDDVRARSLRLLRHPHAGPVPRRERMSASGAQIGPAGAPAAPLAAARARTLPAWWPLAALTLAAALIRLTTLGDQSFWFDEAFTPVHVLHRSLIETLHATTKTENSPPLWYILAWADYRVLGNGAWALRLPSALAGIALVPVAWGIGRELAGRVGAIAMAALIAFGPIFVWYSQEARVYGLYVLSAGVLILCFLRLLRLPDRRRAIEFAAAGAFALLTHYFTAFLLAGMAVWLLAAAGPEVRRRSLPALGAIAVVGLALLPLVNAQAGRNTSWIGSWPLAERLEAIPSYFLVGYNGSALGHGIELLVALPLLAAAGLGAWRLLEAPGGSERARGTEPNRRAAALTLWLTACGLLLPLGLALAGKDYLAPRNVLGAMLPAAGLIVVLATWPGNGRLGPALLALGAAGLLAISVDTALSPRLQRADWRGAAPAAPRSAQIAVVTNLVGTAPLEYYVPGLAPLPAHRSVAVRYVVEIGEKPLIPIAGTPPPGFTAAGRWDAHGVVGLRFAAPAPVLLSEEQLRHDTIDAGNSFVLTPGNARAAR